MSSEPSTGPWPNRDTLVEGIVLDYLKAVDAGQAPDPKPIIAKHPDVAIELERFFADEKAMAALVGGTGFQSCGTARTGLESSAPSCGRFTVLRPLAKGGMGEVAAADMKEDKDLDPLRQREDFQNLLKELQAKGGKP
jgi:hypothetical protein